MKGGLRYLFIPILAGNTPSTTNPFASMARCLAVACQSLAKLYDSEGDVLSDCDLPFPPLDDWLESAEGISGPNVAEAFPWEHFGTWAGRIYVWLDSRNAFDLRTFLCKRTSGLFKVLRDEMIRVKMTSSQLQVNTRARSIFPGWRFTFFYQLIRTVAWCVLRAGIVLQYPASIRDAACESFYDFFKWHTETTPFLAVEAPLELLLEGGKVPMLTHFCTAGRDTLTASDSNCFDVAAGKH